jgi:hypothetical protein
MASSALTQLALGARDLLPWAVSPVEPWYEWRGSYDATKMFGSGGTLTASAVNGTNSAWTDPNDPKGYRSFGGSGNSIDMGTQLGRPAEWTIIAAFNPGAVGTECVCGSMDAGGGSAKAWGRIDYDGTGTLKYSFGDDTLWSAGATTDAGLVVANTWVVVTLRYTTTQTVVEFWVDGVSKAVTTTATNAAESSGASRSWRIAKLGDFNRNFNGDIGQVLIWNRPLSDGERADVEGVMIAKYVG